MKAKLDKLISYVRPSVGGAVLLSLIGLTLYGFASLVAKYVPAYAPITSGSEVVLHQPCIQKRKDKEGKEVCARKGQIQIYTVSHMRSMQK